MQLILVFLGAVLGLSYGYNYEGFVFSSDICMFAGITLIMPTLFKVKFSDIFLIFEHKTLMLKGLLANFLLIPLIAIGVGLLTDNFGIAAGLFLLSVLSGGGMVMHWIKKSGADTSLGFVLLFVNLIFVSLSLLMLHNFGIYSAQYFGEAYSDEINVSNFAQMVIILLIIVPFILSRVILFIKPLQNLIEKNQSYIGKFSLFSIIFYLFGLQSSQLLFDLYDFEIELFYVSIIAVTAFYILIFILAKLLYNLDNPQEKAAFWHSITRYITLALLISTFTTSTFGVSMLLPIMFAYIVQISFAIYLTRSESNK